MLFAGALLASGSAFGFGSLQTTWQSLYPGSNSDNELIAATGSACQLCHVNSFGGAPYTSYGWQMRQNGSNQAALLAIEGLDADGQGSSNITEINAGTQPGWCVSGAPGCQNLGYSNNGSTSPATPPAGVTLDPQAGPQPPMADAGGPYVGLAGSPVAFDGLGSTDADGTIVSYSWNFGDGSNGSGATPSHTYVSSGLYNVTLTVTDNDGLTDTANSTADISPVGVPVPPVADAGGPYTGNVGVAVGFDGTGSADPDGNVVSYSWNFGDGSTGSGASPSHAYSAAGNYNVTLTVTDNDGLTDTDTTSATIDQQSGGKALYDNNCGGCHGDPFSGPPVDQNLAGVRRVTGARTCTIDGAIYGTSVYPGGVPSMQYLQGLLSDADILAISKHLNSTRVSQAGVRRAVTACAGCHGLDGKGGPVGESILGANAQDISDAIAGEPDMRYMSCIPTSPDIVQMGAVLSKAGGGCDDEGCGGGDGAGAVRE